MAVLFPDAIARPTKNKQAVRDKAIDELCREVTKWWRSKYREDSTEILEIRGDLCKVLDDSGWLDDGYEICRDLERDCGWAPNAELVAIADRWNYLLMKHHRIAVAEWVAECKIEPKYQPGAVVRARWSGQVIDGTICRVEASHANYTIQRAGDGPGCGAVVPYEAVIELEVANAAKA